MTATATHHGWAIFPCLPNGKAPWGKYARHGHNSASSDPNAWLHVPDEANWGVACAASGLVVVDIDSGDIPAWCPPTYTVRTGRGWHLYYLATPGDTYRGTIGTGIDIKHHGYVIAAGSRHPDGHLYHVTNDRPPAPLTEELRSLLLDDQPTTHQPAGSRPARRLGKYREFLQTAWTDATTGSAVRQNPAMAGIHDQAVDVPTPTQGPRMRIIQNPAYDESLTLLLVRPTKGNKLHIGCFAHGKVDDLSLGCGRTMKDPIAVVGFADGGPREPYDYVNLNYSLDALCSVCFDYAKYAQRDAGKPGHLTI